MGFNISGIAINKNLDGKLDELSKILDFYKTEIKFLKEINFETASENWKEDGFIDVYFSENGTLIFASLDLLAGAEYSYIKTNILTFSLSENSMAFDFTYTENGTIIRSKTEINNELLDESGKELDVEESSEDTSETIWNQIAIILGKRYWDIQPDEKCFRYKLERISIPNERPIPQKTNELHNLENTIKDKKSIDAKELFLLIFLIIIGILFITGIVYFLTY